MSYQSQRVYDFKEQNKVGKAGERRLMLRFGFKKTHDKDKSGDAVASREVPELGILAGDKVEIKTEKYALEEGKPYARDVRSPNIFVERYSEDKSFTDGGPYRAVARSGDRPTWMAHLFAGNDRLFVVRCDHLVAATDAIVARLGLDLKPIQNKGYKTLGYAVPMTELRAEMSRLGHALLEVTCGKIDGEMAFPAEDIEI